MKARERKYHSKAKGYPKNNMTIWEQSLKGLKGMIISDEYGKTGVSLPKDLVNFNRISILQSDGSIQMLKTPLQSHRKPNNRK